MTQRRTIALGLADALIAGPRDGASARQRCEQALGSRARWIARLAHAMVQTRANDWRDTRRKELALAIEQSPHFDATWRAQRQPRLRKFPTATPSMSPLQPALIDCVVPDLPTPRDVARWLDLTPDELTWLTGPLERPLPALRELHKGQHTSHYHQRWVEKRSGGVRLIEIPKAQLRTIQRRILRGILEYVPPHEAAHGFRERRSCVTNARPHVGQAVVMRMDLEDFFGGIGGGKVYEFFAALGYPAASARALTRLTTHATPPSAWSDDNLRHIEGGARTLSWLAKKRLASAHLPQGAPSSPALANLCAFNFDVRIRALAEKFGAQYTRYADDLTFSGGEELARRSHAFEAHVAAIALDEGFRVNHRKTRVMRSATRQLVTSIVVNHTPNIRRADYDRLKATLHNCLRHGPATQCTSGVAVFRNHLAGHIAHLSAIHPARGARLKHLFDQAFAASHN